MASANVQRTIAGGVTATRVLSAQPHRFEPHPVGYPAFAATDHRGQRRCDRQIGGEPQPAGGRRRRAPRARRLPAVAPPAAARRGPVRPRPRQWDRLRGRRIEQDQSAESHKEDEGGEELHRRDIREDYDLNAAADRSNRLVNHATVEQRVGPNYDSPRLWTISTSSSAASAPWGARRSIIWRAEASACWGSSAIRLAMTAAPRMDRPASSGWAISSTRPMSRCSGAPTRYGANSKRPAGGGSFMSPASPRSVRPTAPWCGERWLLPVSTSLRHEVLSAPELMRRFPAFRVPQDYVAVLQPEGGILEAEHSLRAMLALATAAGADIRSGETVQAIEPRAGSVRVTTDRGIVEAGAAIIAVGAWTKTLLPEFACRLRVTREVMAWFAPTDAELLCADQFPVFIIESRHGMHYGIPPLRGEPVRRDQDRQAPPSRRNRRPRCLRSNRVGRGQALIRAAIADHLPAANGRAARRQDLPLHHDAGRTIFSSTACPALPTSSSPRRVPATASSSRR